MVKAFEVFDESVETDVLIVGGGLTGCMAAIEASRHQIKVLLAVNGKIGKSGCTPLAGGPTGADFMVDSASVSSVLGLDDLGPERPDSRDSPELFKEDILKDGEYLNNPRIVDVYVTEAPRQMKRLMDMGLKVIAVTFAHGVRFPRGVIALNRDIASTLIRNVSDSPITVLEDMRINDLLTVDGRCVGGVGVNIKTGDTVGVKAKAVIIATGGWHMAYHTSGSDELTGDGQAMAFRAGAELVDMEMMTFTDRYLVWPPIASRDNFIWDWAKDRKLVNNKGEEIFSEIPVEDRGVQSAQKIAQEISEGRSSEHGGVYLLNPDDVILDGYVKMGSFLEDWAHDDIKFEVTVGCHYCCGGIKVNEKTETSVSGLYAAGEASGGLFGARRVASALMEATVQGSIAGANAVKYAEKIGDVEPDTKQTMALREKLLAPLERTRGIKPVELRKRVRGIASKTLSLHRSGPILVETLRGIERVRKDDVPRLWVSGTKSRRFNKEWIECLALDNMLLCLEASARSALLRKESRGFHRRIDYPERDDNNWLKNIVVQKRRDRMKATAIPIVMTTASSRKC